MPYETLTLDLGERSYPIYIGTNFLISPVVGHHIDSSQVLIVSNTTVAPHYASTLITALRGAGAKGVELLELPDGEVYKTLSVLNQIFDRLLELKFNRKCILIALGGGVVGDMCGFAAACYQRGVPFIQVPTTLLSQVDSSVGGKTGVNHPLGKNMIGAFYQPRAVLIDTTVLSTLPDRELSAGLAEVIKYGLIYDKDFFAWLQEHMDALMAREPEALRYAIMRSCQIKADVVAQDERESGIRAILNLGHTYGHAIETELGYGEWLHGEAVAVGMVLACELSERLGWIDSQVVEHAKTLLKKANLPVDPPITMDAESFVSHMKIDKKVTDGQIRLVLLRGLGQAITTSNFDIEVFNKRLSERTQ